MVNHRVRELDVVGEASPPSEKCVAPFGPSGRFFITVVYADLHLPGKPIAELDLLLTNRQIEMKRTQVKAIAKCRFLMIAFGLVDE